MSDEKMRWWGGWVYEFWGLFPPLLLWSVWYWVTGYGAFTWQSAVFFLAVFVSLTITAKRAEERVRRGEVK